MDEPGLQLGTGVRFSVVLAPMLSSARGRREDGSKEYLIFVTSQRAQFQKFRRDTL